MKLRHVAMELLASQVFDSLSADLPAGKAGRLLIGRLVA